MRRVISLSALISGLLALPAFAVVPPREQDPVLPGAQVPESGNVQASLTDLHAAMQAGPGDVGGMKKLHRQMVADVQNLLTEQLAEGPAAPTPVEGRTGDFPETTRQQGGPPIRVQTSSIESKIVDLRPSVMPPGAVMEQRMEKAAYLGITTSPVSPTLREQLGLAKGFGLVVDYVEKDSPADKAGLKVHDVLQRLNDQWLINAPQLSVLVRSRKAGDEITLTAIRAAKPLELKATLAEKELPVMDDDPMHLPRPGWVMPGPHAQIPEGSTPAEPSAMATVISRSDDTHAITLSMTNGQKSVVVRESKTGKVLYDGPANTDDDLKSLPQDIRDKIKTMERNLHQNLHPDQSPKQPPK